MSPLLRLPAELRIKIYENTLSVREIRLCNEHVFGSLCSDCAETGGSHARRRWRVDYHTKWHFYGSLNLLLTCRQIYTETKLLPFSLNTFASHETGLDLRLHQAFKDWQFEAIGSIRVHMSAASAHYIFSASCLHSVLDRIGRMAAIKRVWVERRSRVRLNTQGLAL
jgi:hypothetical protein